MPTVADVVMMLPLAGLIVGAGVAWVANAMPAGRKVKMSMTDSRTARVFPLALFLKFFLILSFNYLNGN
jgi:hypothetical protein